MDSGAPTASTASRRTTPGWARSPWAVFVGVRLAYLCFTAFTLVWAPLPPNRFAVSHAWGGISNTFFGTFEHFDADYFLLIAREGYTTSDAAFMPTYPGLVHLLGPLVGSNLVAALLLSLAAGAVGVQLVAVVAREILGPAVARDTTLLLALYPVAFIFTSAYSEGLFLAAAAAATVCATRGRPVAAGALAGIAVSTRLIGIALVPMLVVLLWSRARERGWQLLVPVIALPAAGLAAVSLYFDRTLGDGLAFLHAQREWGRHVSVLGPIDGIWRSARAAAHGVWTIATTSQADYGRVAISLDCWNVVDFTLLLGAAALTVVAFRRLGRAYGIYSAAVLVIATSSPVTDGGEVLQSMVRLLLADFPIFIAGAALLQSSGSRRVAALCTLAAVGAVTGAAFARTVWIA